MPEHGQDAHAPPHIYGLSRKETLDYFPHKRDNAHVQLAQNGNWLRYTQLERGQCNPLYFQHSLDSLTPCRTHYGTSLLVRAYYLLQTKVQLPYEGVAHRVVGWFPFQPQHCGAT